MKKKKQLEIVFKKLLIEMFKYCNYDVAPIIINKYVKKLLYEVSIRMEIK